MARKRGLDHDHVINAGFTVIDRDGVERVSLRAVADLLDVQPPSLYSHVAGLGGLLDDLAIAATADFGETLRASAIGIAHRLTVPSGTRHAWPRVATSGRLKSRRAHSSGQRSLMLLVGLTVGSHRGDNSYHVRFEAYDER